MDSILNSIVSDNTNLLRRKLVKVRPSKHQLQKLLLTARSGDAARVLIQHGADPNYTYEGGKSALHKIRNADVALALINEGAKVNARDARGQTPLFWNRGGSDDAGYMTDLLIEHGAFVRARDTRKRQAIHYAPSPHALVALLEHGLDINSRDADRNTPLMFASQSMIPVFIHYGADISAQNMDGKTTLMMCIERGNQPGVIPNVFRLAKSANVQDTAGNTALHYAALASKRNIDFALDVAEVLITKGADTSVKNKRGQTPKDLAVGKLKSMLQGSQ